MVSSLRRLDLVRPKQESPLYKNLGWGNRITLFRSWLIAATAGFLFQPWPDGPLLSWLPGMIYFAGAILDRVDGYVARRSGQSSLFGIELDTVADAIGLAVASLLAVGYGQAHWSFLLMGLAYYAFHAGIYWRKKQNLPVYALPPAMHRRVWAGFQMGYLVVALWPLFYPPLTLIGGFAFMLPALIGFVIDWLIVSGRINRQAANTDRRFYQLTVFSQAIFQPLLRITIVLLLAISILRSGLPPMANTGIVGFSFIASAGFILTSLAILLGIAGRYFALLLIGLLGWYYLNNPMYYLDYLLFCCVIWSLLLGSGRFSLWQEDDRWLNRYDGA
ncbi:MAG: CDP-alcohol phosphatidyltransferase family protein [Gammaproteobacteria bacterium]|nr:CDP-alcohol phosphatidyltransferase family protein [Gammaproteobacteria bacterium]MDD9959114.1 CDP-alcohol phosphatidyltransferase family protein [Gammaproteobacteria bacterium]